ncbi:topisomerase 2 associated protein [Grosmannia clavigera kw1407]|uniref:Topisomerase 2 associated protein n=1 Tax=Grosmannia clavigera (strain kw1407 / UAMH 11150) TaxID=655863 RepID=F0X846_GROCL|nr:topoisomerase 2 associated protein [Grosmannia clavigera kw1407]EFX05251.1 topisomerase 2 associated protein [Grosmannia clavigera kw1407]
MSFFGFDPTRHNASAPGFSQINDPFAGLSNAGVVADEALDFDEYDGLGDNLEETGDAFNDDTFGDGANDAGPSISSKVGSDFDFFGQTAKVADAIEEEHARFHRLQPMAKAAASHERAAPQNNQGYAFFAPSSSRPARSGYEKYKEPEPEMEVDAALWGVAPKKPALSSSFGQDPKAAAPGGRKIMSLEEVEAAMRAKSKPAVSQPQDYQQQVLSSVAPAQPTDYGYAVLPEFAALGDASQRQGHPISILQRPQSQQMTPATAQASSPAQIPLQYQPTAFHQAPGPVQPTQILQNPDRLSGGENFGLQGYPTHQRQQSSHSGPGHIITHPSQVANLSDEEKAAYLEQEAKRAKRNHKIFILSKDNGLMTPQDKSFVTRIQLQQLVSATGNPNEHGTDEALREDFYYQVLSHIRGSSRQHPSQPLNNFAQTYLFQTGSRMNSRRFLNRERGAENHMQRMEQQVQRAVEAAKNRPKNKQLVIEGSLGKISFSNAKTPKPLLNIKREENGSAAGSPDVNHRPVSAHKQSPTSTGARAVDRKSVLSSIEKVYMTLMQLEDHGRKMPPPVSDPNDIDLMQRQLEWSETAQHLSAQLWRELKVHEPIGEFPVHPFIAFLSIPKGKKAIPRVFQHLSHELRATVLTMIVVHLDQLDIVRQAQVNNDVQLNAALRESIDLFMRTVMNTLFGFMNDLPLDLVTGVLGLITNLKVDVIAKSRVGTSVLTMILSRAEILKQSGAGTSQQWQTWEIAYTNFFNVLEPILPYIFPGTVSSGEDMYVWQLLAALGIGANPDQQQRLVLSVKDRVMDTVAVAKTLPVDLSTQRLQNVNLFMRSIGLDVELLQ